MALDHKYESDDDVRWRRELGVQVAQAYAASPKIAAVALAGSVARGWADRYSDVELDVFWQEPPTDQERLAVLAQAGCRVDVQWADPPSHEAYRAILRRTNGHASQVWPYEDDEWSEHFYVNRVNIGVSAFLAVTVERWLDDVITGLDTDDDKHILIASLQQGQPLHGVERLQAWKNRIHYPDELAAAVLRELLEVDESWWQRDMLAGRDALIPLHDLLCRSQRWLLRLLLALNRIWLPDPRFKWAGRLVEQMPLAPPDLARRLRLVFQVPPPAAVAEMEALALETLSLVDRYVPAVDTGFAREWLGYRRAVWEGADGERWVGSSGQSSASRLLKPREQVRRHSHRDRQVT
jgi:hypothetical protein